MMEMTDNFGIGIFSCMISSLFFGSMFVPIKPFETQDGFFVQWMMGLAILTVGFIINVIEGFPEFYPLAMLGGVLWATGNLTAIPIVNTIGMGLGILIWSFTTLLFSWASSRFGWFNIRPQIPASDIINYVGLIFAFISTVMFFFIESAPQDRKYQEKIESEIVEDKELLLTEVSDQIDESVTKNSTISLQKRTLAITMSLFAGILYGISFAPVIYIQDNYPNASKRGLPYMFAHSSGVCIACTFYFICYCIYRENMNLNSNINVWSSIGAFIVGILCSIAQAAWFVANENITQAITFPIITRFPGIFASLWDVLYFKEIQGRKNIQMLLRAIGLLLIGGVLSGLSKIVHF